MNIEAKDCENFCFTFLYYIDEVLPKHTKLLLKIFEDILEVFVKVLLHDFPSTAFCLRNYLSKLVFTILIIKSFPISSLPCRTSGIFIHYLPASMSQTTQQLLFKLMGLRPGYCIIKLLLTKQRSHLYYSVYIYWLNLCCIFCVCVPFDKVVARRDQWLALWKGLHS